MNQKFIVLILLMSLSQYMFIFISSFVFGYCVCYYSYNFFKPKSVKDEIIDFILRYNIKHGIVNKKAEQIKISNGCYSEKLEHEFNFLHNCGKIWKKIKKLMIQTVVTFLAKIIWFFAWKSKRTLIKKRQKIWLKLLIV